MCISGYLSYNHYTRHIEDVHKAAGAKVQYLGYRTDVDKFFSARMFDPQIPCFLNQDMPSRILEIVQFLALSGKSSKSRIASYLLDLDGEWREKLAKEIDEELRRQRATGHARPFSTSGDTALSVACWTIDRRPFDGILALEYARIVLLVNSEEKRLLLNLIYSKSWRLEDVSWSWISLASIPSNELPALHVKADGLRRRRIARAKAEKGKIGRKKQCPCGSGKKFKRCCLGRA